MQDGGFIIRYTNAGAAFRVSSSSQALADIMPPASVFAGNGGSFFSPPDVSAIVQHVPLQVLREKCGQRGHVATLLVQGDLGHAMYPPALSPRWHPSSDYSDVQRGWLVEGRGGILKGQMLLRQGNAAASLVDDTVPPSRQLLHTARLRSTAVGMYRFCTATWCKWMATEPASSW